MKIKIADYPQLQFLCWSLPGAEYLDGDQAFGLYEQYWRWVEEDKLTPAERELIETLTRTYGGGVLDKKKGIAWMRRGRFPRMSDEEIERAILRESFGDVRRLLRAVQSDPETIRQIERVCRAQIDEGYGGPWTLWRDWAIDPAGFRQDLRTIRDAARAFREAP